MLKPSLQLRLGQQLTMTPQLQQAIRLLQMPALELQAHIRELLESNVMLEPVEETESTGLFEAIEPTPPPEPMLRKVESSVETVEEENWNEHSAGPSETPWNASDDDERQQEFANDTEQSLQEYLLEQLELANLAPRELAIARGIVDAINEDGYLSEPLDEIARTLNGRTEALPLSGEDQACDAAEVERVLGRVQALDPPGIAARSVGECIESSA